MVCQSHCGWTDTDCPSNARSALGNSDGRFGGPNASCVCPYHIQPNIAARAIAVYSQHLTKNQSSENNRGFSLERSAVPEPRLVTNSSDQLGTGPDWTADSPGPVELRLKIPIEYNNKIKYLHWTTGTIHIYTIKTRAFYFILLFSVD